MPSKEDCANKHVKFCNKNAHKSSWRDEFSPVRSVKVKTMILGMMTMILVLIVSINLESPFWRIVWEYALKDTEILLPFELAIPFL